ncbi:MAG TPA: DUF882 domain-containing protein [Stellaceae bacterium]|nr:DUF882 domain-containing protein [Stellaceae bacterium]
MNGGKRHARRDLLALAAAAAAGVIAAPLFPRPAIALTRAPYKRTLAFRNLRTGDQLSLVYWADGRYLPEAIELIAHVMRDGRTGETHPIDRRLIDLMARLRATLRSSEPLQIVCGYRSPATNALLRETSEGVAANSLHMAGAAVDLRVKGRGLAAVRRAALSLKSGGVGYYPRSNFVHIDVGPVRRW